MSSLLIKSFLPNAYVPERVCDQYTDHKPVKRYSALYLKRCSHTDFNSYVVGMERETKDLLHTI